MTCILQVIQQNRQLPRVTTSWEIRLKTDSKLYFYVYQADGTVKNVSSVQCTLNDWQHIKVAAVDGDLSISIDGTLGTSNTYSGDINKSNHDTLYLGVAYYQSRPFTGAIDRFDFKCFE